MAVDNRQIAENVLAAVGGKENIVSATNYMTRLRLTLKDNGASVDDEAVKAIKGVLGVKVYVIGNASILSLIAAYAAGGTVNLMMGAGAGIIACLVTAAIVYFFGFTPERLEEDAKAAQLG